MSDRRFTRDELLSETRIFYSEEWQVRLQDVDAAGIVFFARILEACHDVYINFWQKQGPDFKEGFQTFRFLAPIVHAEADYLKPLRFLDDVQIQIIKIDIYDKKYILGYRLVEKKQQQVVAVAQIVHVFVDAVSFQRTLIPIEIKMALQKRMEQAS